MSDSTQPRILIIGAGPTGLGAAHRLNEVGHTNWLLVEKNLEPGGLSASFRDEKGFTWDIGGHVLFSHYAYFDRLMNDLMGNDGWVDHERESWVWLLDRFVPYPFQLNIRRLPHDAMRRCLSGLVKLYKEHHPKPRNFGEWIDATFGEGIGNIFMRPYNFKVWAYPPEMMSYSWIGERVVATDLERVLNNIFDAKDDVSWGPNNRFRFPKHGGTGAIWRECARRLPGEKLRYGCEASRVDVERREVTFSDGSVEKYDYLLNTMPLTTLLERAGLDAMRETASQLSYSVGHIFGIGLRGRPNPELSSKCWMYFPEDNCPFYRVTLFSNYSPNNVPNIQENWSLMAEVSESPYKPVSASRVLEDVIEGMLNTQLIDRREDIIDAWSIRVEHSYPTPTLDRDNVIFDVLPALDRMGIASRGRFGAWRYEVANQDHSLMQGVEWVNRVLYGTDELTLWHPNIVNDMSRPELKGRA